MHINWRPKLRDGFINWAPRTRSVEAEQQTTIGMVITEHSPPSGSIVALAERLGAVVALTINELSPPSAQISARAFAPPDITEAEAIVIARKAARVRRTDDAEELIAFDFRAYLAPGETINAMSVVCSTPGFEDLEGFPGRILYGPPGVAGRLVAQLIGGGTPGVRYLITCTVETSNGRRLERSYSMRVLGKWRTSPRVV